MEREEFQITNRRSRSSVHMRELVAQVVLSHRQFIQPLFIDETLDKRTPFPSLNEINSDTLESALAQIESDLKSGISKFLIFPVPKNKALSNLNYDFATTAIRTIIEKFGDQIWLAADVCLCSYTLHGHCGILNSEGTKVLNHESVTELANYALQLAQAGADCIAPSDMMDGRIAAIRSTLDQHQLDLVSIMSYSSKFSSQFYGPFRDACRSAPQGTKLTDRKTYQLSPNNGNDALQCAIRDAKEGADILMVKPAAHYLDVISKVKSVTNKPVAGYHVSGEYQSIELLAKSNLVDRAKAQMEVWTALKRAGADVIISYAARHAKKWIEEIEY
ncbi:MAG: porphobilinogen synthase [Cyclobacteriaceae bacterium]|nr:porphobilinogen synthase [Cyclobacteriaceae bacterium]